MAQNPAETPDAPFDTNPQRQSGGALRGAAVASSPAHQRFEESLTASNDQLRGIRPPLRQVHDRPRFGYPDYADRQPTIDDVIDNGGQTHFDTPTSVVAEGGFQGSPRNQAGGY